MYRERREKLVLVAGSLNYDITLQVNHFAPPKSVVTSIKRFLGGSGGNAAVGVARLLGKGRVWFLGAVGDDEVGHRHIEALRKEGIDVSFISIHQGIESGQAFVAVKPDGTSAVYSYYGANTLLKPEALSKNLMKKLAETSTVIIMNPPLQVAMRLAELAKEAGATVLWDPGALSRLGIEKLSPILPHVDIFMPNEEELRLIIGGGGIAELRKLLQHNESLRIVVKRGVEGADLYDPSQGIVLHVDAFRPEWVGMEVKSTVGCGDAFIGAFGAAKHEGMEDSDALIYASCASGVNAGYENPRGVPEKEVFEDRFLPVCREKLKVVSRAFINNI